MDVGNLAGAVIRSNLLWISKISGVPLRWFYTRFLARLDRALELELEKIQKEGLKGVAPDSSVLLNEDELMKSFFRKGKRARVKKSSIRAIGKSIENQYV